MEVMVKKKFVEGIMDFFADERDYKILEKDKYTFLVLGRIMGGECELLLTDHERLIICFTCRRNAESRHVAICNFRPNGDLAGVGLVYTREEYRSSVTKSIQKQWNL